MFGDYRALVTRSLIPLAAATTLVTGSSAVVALETPSSHSHPSQPAIQARPDPLLPDLTPLRAANLSLQRTGEDRKIRFDSRLANIGRGPIEVRPRGTKGCPRGKQHASQIIYRDKDDNGFFKRGVDTRYTRKSAGCTLYHPAHEHWHFQATALYSITRPQEKAPIVVRQRKMSFCLRDSERVPERLGGFHQPQFYGDCSKTSPQGISHGWLDLYASYLPGQALRLPRRLGNGVYCLGIAVDPLNRLWESDETNQASTKAFRLHGSRVLPVTTTPCAG